MNSSSFRCAYPDAELARLAERRHAVATTGDLRALGLTVNDIKYRRRVGRLHPLYHGVYAIGHPDITLHGRFLAAVVAVGADAVLSHRSAAVLWGFAPKSWTDDATIDVAVPRRLRQRKGVRIHLLTALDRNAWTRRHRVPVTTASRTILDLARTDISDRTLKRVLGQAQVDHRVSVPQLRTAATREKHRGAKRILLLTAKGPRPTRSGLEDSMHDLCDQLGSPGRRATRQSTARRWTSTSSNTT